MKDILAPHRSRLLDTAYDDVLRWHRSPDAQIEQRRPDSFWLQLFRAPEAERRDPSVVHDFLSSFHLEGRREWDQNAVGLFLGELPRMDVEDPIDYVSSQTERLSKCGEGRAPCLEAASKIGMFARPSLAVLIFNPLVWRAVKHRRQLTARSPFAGIAALAVRQPRYPTYHAALAQVLEAERGRDDFGSKIAGLECSLTADVLQVTSRDYLERRLLDKLLFWEGLALRYRGQRLAIAGQ
jgi:hypothetical protein